MSLVLDDTTKTIEIVLGGAVTTNELEWTAHYADYTVGSFTPINSHGVTNGAVDVTMVAAPAASTQRLIQNMTVYNADTVAATVTIKLDDPAVERRLIVVTLAAGYSLHFKEDMWQVFDTSGGMLSGASIHDVLGPMHGDAATDAVTRGSIVVGNATPLWDELVIGAASTHLESDGTDITWQANITMADDTWIGIGGALERIIFDAAGDISVMGANFGVGTQIPGNIIEAAGAGAIIECNATSGNPTFWLSENGALGWAMIYNVVDNAFYISQYFVANWMSIQDGSGFVGFGNQVTAGTLVELQNVQTLTGNLPDGYVACLTLDPGYTGAFTVTIHDYIDVQDVSVAGGAAVTDAAVMRFDAAIGTHKCLPAAFQTTDSNTDTTNWAGGLLINILGTLYKIPYIAA